MKRRMKQVVSLCVVTGILLGLSSGVFAGPDLPVVSDRGDGYKEATFTGNQSAGISLVSSWSGAPYIALNVENLTRDITPASSVDGILLSLWGGNGGDGTDFFGGDGGAGRAAARLWSPLSIPWYWGPELMFSGGGYGIVTSGPSADAIGVFSAGGRGGTGGWSAAGEGGHGGTGGRAGLLYVQSFGDLQTSGASSRGLVAQNVGGNGGTGGDANGKGGRGGTGGQAWGTQVISSGSIETAGESAPGILANTRGGSGGKGGHAGGPYGEGGAGGAGGAGYTTAVIASGNITTSGNKSPGIFMDFQGGSGGSGGDSGGAYGEGGAGGSGAGGGSAGFPGVPDSVFVQYSGTGSIATSGVSSPGISAQSQGGAGGNGGHTGGLYAAGGNGGKGGDAFPVQVQGWGNIDTVGDSSAGILAVSKGGLGGKGGTAGGAYGAGGAGGVGGAGGSVQVSLMSGRHITTAGSQADGISARSLGGAGGDGGTGGGLAGVGGGARGSGPGGSITIGNDGQIATSGVTSRGVFAESVGGFAGDAGVGGGVAAWGGSVNSTGAGGDVAVTNRGTISTGGGNSTSIFAQSVGGGGGSGAGTGGLVSLGGTGSAGGKGGAVAVTNDGHLQTVGDVSRGIVAQSVGGGGGDGGGASSLVAFGGRGNSTGDGGNVTVHNTGTIVTAGNTAGGVVAQSTGGGGGIAGGVVTEDDLPGGSGGGVNAVFFSTGGTGGSGGSGGDVTINHSGSLATSGTDSAGLAGYSIGGGGGSGGRGYSFGIEGTFVRGGDSAQGGSGGQVNVNSTAGSIVTDGSFSSGIHAMSLGGGGGAGGDVISFTGAVQMSGSYVFGGQGGAGGNGNDVQVASRSQVTTLGEHSHGLSAQSIGGGGGAGGAVVNTNLTVGGMEGMPGMSVALSIGGDGGNGGDGGVVNVANEGDVGTSGFRSYGVGAQSVGGGGGDGGSSLTTVMAIESFSVSVNLGGAAGKGGHGDSVSVTNSGSITSAGESAYGILGQSVGGGGGSGGSSSLLHAEIGVLTKLWQLLLPSVDINSDLTLGGSGGDGGSGGRVDIANTGDIDTAGRFAHGILAQSVGGGGGSGGNATKMDFSLGIDLWELVGLGGFLDFSSSFTLGGSGGVDGDGGVVVVRNQGSIATQGHFANGVLAQSVGGGGGSLGDSTEIDADLPDEIVEAIRSVPIPLMNTTLRPGGSGGAMGDGGEVRVYNDGRIATQGHFANGILAQSIGGGGGASGIVVSDEYDLIDPLNSFVRLQGRNGGTGNGGDVIVENSADITTQGVFAHGILAQSIGGGGGFAGIGEELGISSLELGPHARGVFSEDSGVGVGFAGSAGGSGSAGAVSVTHHGNITTSGDMSHGILAQSVAGSGGTAGPVTVTVGSSIMANGANSDGIHAQSLGSRGNGDISITLNGGTVRGGSGSGVGVNFDGGADNTLINHGNISALSGTAIRGSGGNDVVDNYGTVIGGVHLGAGSNAFNNNAGARFDAGAIIDLGVGNTLTNAGILSPGGLGTIMDTTIIGDLVLSASSVLEIEIGGFAPGSFDSLHVAGTVTGGEAGMMSLMDFTPTMGAINFCFLPGFDPAAQMGLGESVFLPFLTADSPVDLALMSCTFSGGPSGFWYNVLQQDGGLSLRAVYTGQTIPAPGAALLAGIGLALLGWGRGRMRR